MARSPKLQVTDSVGGAASAGKAFASTIAAISKVRAANDTIRFMDASFADPLKRPLERAGLPSIRFHDLRHTCATILLSLGVHAKLVQELLAHATLSITLDTYSRVLPGMDDGLADVMGDTLG